MKEFKEYYQETEYFNEYEPHIKSIRMEIRKRKTLFQNLLFNLFLLVFAIGVPTFFFSAHYIFEMNNGLTALSVIFGILSIFGFFAFISLYWIGKFLSYFVSLNKLVEMDIGDGILSVMIWESRYKKRKIKYKRIENLVLTRRYLDSISSKSLDLNCNEVVFLNELIQRDEAIRSKYIETITSEKPLELSTS